MPTDTDMLPPAAGALHSHLTVENSDLIPLRQAQRICTEHLGAELPLELLAGIALRGLHSTEFAAQVLDIITHADLPGFQARA